MELSQTFYTLPNQRRRHGRQRKEAPLHPSQMSNVRRVYSFNQFQNPGLGGVRPLFLHKSRNYSPSLEISTPGYESRGRLAVRRHESCRGLPRIGTSWDSYHGESRETTGFGRRFHSAERKRYDVRDPGSFYTKKSSFDRSDTKLNYCFDSSDHSGADFPPFQFLTVEPYTMKYSKSQVLHPPRSQASWSGALTRSRPSNDRDFFGSSFDIENGTYSYQTFPRKHVGGQSSVNEKFGKAPRNVVARQISDREIVYKVENDHPGLHKRPTTETSLSSKSRSETSRAAPMRRQKLTDFLSDDLNPPDESDHFATHHLSDKVHHHKFAQTEDGGHGAVGDDGWTYSGKCNVQVVAKSPAESLVYQTLPNRPPRETCLARKSESFSVVARTKAERTPVLEVPVVRDENQNEVGAKSVFVKCPESQVPKQQAHSKAFLLKRTNSKSRLLKTEEQVKLAKFRRFFSSANIDSHEFKMRCLVRINTALRKEDRR